jgi:hypothetical protein
MRRIDIHADDSIGVEVRSRIVLNRSGDILCEVPVRGIASAWDYRTLRNALPQCCYRSAMSVECISQNDDGVTAFFADGARAERNHQGLENRVIKECRALR